MGSYLNNAFGRLEKTYLDDKLMRVYDRVREEAGHDSTMIKLSEQVHLSKLYSDLLIDMEKTVKEAFGYDGVRWVSDAWNEVGAKLEMPAFVYENTTVNTAQVSKTIHSKTGSVQKKGDGRESKIALPLILLAAGVLLLLIPDGIRKVPGVVLIVLGVAALLSASTKQKRVNSDQILKSKSADYFSGTSNTRTDSQLEQMRGKNRIILKEWFQTVQQYAMEAEQNELIKERKG